MSSVGSIMLMGVHHEQPWLNQQKIPAGKRAQHHHLVTFRDPLLADSDKARVAVCRSEAHACKFALFCGTCVSVSAALHVDMTEVGLGLLVARAMPQLSSQEPCFLS